MCPTEGAGSSQVGRIHIVNEGMDKTSSPGLACSNSGGKVPWDHHSLEKVRALSFTSRTRAGHRVKVRIQNCLKRKKKQFADCHFWSLSCKKGHYEFLSPPLQVERKGSIELQSTLCYTLQEAQPILKWIWTVRGDHKVGNSWSKYKTIHKMSEKRK